MKVGQLWWVTRTAVMLVVGIVPAILSILLLLLTLLFTAPALGAFADWYAAMIVLAVLGIVGLWGATFQDAEERALPVSVTLILLCCGLLGAVPILVETASMAIDGNAFGGWTFVILLLGPVACAIYYFMELIVVRISRRRAHRRC